MHTIYVSSCQLGTCIYLLRNIFYMVSSSFISLILPFSTGFRSAHFLDESYA